MSVWFSLAIVLVIVILVGAYRKAGRPLSHRGQRLSDLPKFVRSLYQQAGDGAVLHIGHEGSERFLQFRFHRESPSAGWLEFAFPRSPWSHRYFEKVHTRLAEAGFEVNIDETGSEPTSAFARVALIGPQEEQVSDAQRLMVEASAALGISDDGRFTVEVSGSLDKAAVQEWTRQVKGSRES